MEVDAERLLTDGPATAERTVILAHGAGAPMDSAFMSHVATGLAGGKIRVVRFEFPYMMRRRDEGKRRAPDRPAVLLDCWREVIEHLRGSSRLVIGGKSLGGRIASMVADETGVAGLVCLGYPFHPPGSPQRLRVSHLQELSTPTLILQGSRDPFGTREEIPGYPLSNAITVRYLEDGDHSLKPRVRSGRTERQNLDLAVTWAREFVLGL